MHRFTVTVTSLLEFAACGSAPTINEAGSNAFEDAGTKSPCSRSGDVYIEGLSRISSGGALTTRPLDVNPNPPAMGQNTWRFELRDAANAPLRGARVVMTSFMPDHLHAGPSVEIAELGNGEYVATMNIVLMAGLYRFSIAVEDRRDDSAAYEFCVR